MEQLLEPAVPALLMNAHWMKGPVEDIPALNRSLHLPDDSPRADAVTDETTPSVAASASASAQLSTPSPPTTVTAATTAASARRFPSDLKTIPCTWPGCGKVFNRPARLTAHLRSHTNDRPFRCPHPPCTKAYLEEKHLRQHIKGSHTHERCYTCPSCGKAFLTATRLRRHAAVHEGQERFRCRGHDPACTRAFRKHQTLQRHIRVDHLHQPAFACSQGGASCSAMFDSAGALRRHVERAHGVPKFWCEECLAAKTGEEEHGTPESTSGTAGGFATRALLETHMRREHARCVFCDARCAGPAELLRHMDMHHSGKTVADRKTTTCPHAGCGKTFTRRSNLNVHIRAAHEGLRFVCGVKEVREEEGEEEEEDEKRGHLQQQQQRGHHDTNDPERAAWDAATQGCGRGFVSRMKLEEHILYVHLRRPRPLATVVPEDADKSAVSATITTTLLDSLAGMNRTLSCVYAGAGGCTARFVRHHDLQVHLQRDHGGSGATTTATATATATSPMALSFSPVPVFSATAKPSLLAGLYPGDDSDSNSGMDMGMDMGDDDNDGAAAAFWAATSSTDTSATVPAADADALLDSYLATPDLTGTANRDGDDNDNNDDEEIIVHSNDRLANNDDDAQWQMDEAEMRRLIGDADGSLLDPNLFL